MSSLEKTPLRSKKFIAFFVALAILAGILVTALLTQAFGWSMVTFMSIGITGICALSIGYILSQKSLDSFMRGLKNIPGVRKDDEDN